MEIKQIKLTPDTSWQTQQLKQIESYARINFIPVLLPDTATLLYKTLGENQPIRILEIGTAIGYSGTIILNTCPDANLTTIEVDENSYLVAEKHFEQFNLTNRVTQHLGDALTVLEQLANNDEKFDFVFLDGPKGQYIKYLPFITTMLNKGGIIFADNVLFRHMVDGPEFVPHKHRTLVVNLRKYLNEVSTLEWQTEILDIGDGVAISKKL